MADTPVTLPTEDELAQLPVRAIVAYAARCARRVQPLYNLNLTGMMPDEELKKHCLSIDRAVTLAERWARNEPVSFDDFEDIAEDVRAAGQSADVALAALGATIPATPSGPGAVAFTAFTAAGAAFAAFTAAAAAKSGTIVGKAADIYAAAYANAAYANAAYAASSGARRDFDILRAHRFKLDAPVDASESGVCGELWIDGPPEWYTQGLEQLRKLGVLKKPNRRKASASTPAVDPTELQKLRVQINELEQEKVRAESSFRLARDEATRFHEKFDGADALARSHEEARVEEVESHKKTREEVQNLQRERLELQEQLNQRVSRVSDLELQLLKVRGQLAQVQQKSEVLQVQSVWWYWEKFFCPKSMFQLMALIVLGAMVMFALFGIGEVYERQALDRWIKSQVETQRERLVDRGPVERPSNRLESLEAIRSQLLILSLAGASTRDETIAGVRDQLKSLQLESTGLPPVPSVAMGPPGWWPWFPYQSSDLLLSLVVLFSGTVGAVITTLRRDKPLTLRDLGHGLAAGFITFLAVRGGKSVFLLDADPLLLINPYNSAFFGLLAGMFTELAYGLLSSLAEEMSGRLQSAFSAPKESLDRPRLRSSETQTPREGSRDTTTSPAD